MKMENVLTCLELEFQKCENSVICVWSLIKRDDPELNGLNILLVVVTKNVLYSIQKCGIFINNY